MNSAQPAPRETARGKAWAVALFLVGALLIALAILYSSAPKKVTGIGLSRLLQEEELWRIEQRRQGRSINDRDLWEIQEEVAWRSEISREGVKGLVRRAANARDQAFRAEGLLLGGTLEPAAALNLRLATQQPSPFQPEEIARLYRRTADAEWRGEFGDPATHYHQAIAALKDSQPGLRRDLWMDLALWHWSRANFFPEDIAAELRAGLAAATEAAELGPVPPAEAAAIFWLQSSFYLRLALVESDTEQLDAAQNAILAAANSVDSATAAEFNATIQHTLGLVFYEQGQRQQQPTAWPSAVAAFSKALETRTGKIGSGKVDVRIAERRLTERAESLAARALTLATMPGTQDEARSALRDARGALELTLPDDPGPAWIMAQQAEILASLRLQSDGTDTTAAALNAANLALDQYPLELANHAGVPSRLQIVRSILPLKTNTTTAAQTLRQTLQKLRTQTTDPTLQEAIANFLTP